ncbi:MAG: restriction endonuclease [Flavipsychrobacter sp.]|nr:restriction endonuclease [Flavipsychrobacter sp.]
MNLILAEEKLDSLPFDMISWKKFEKICTDVLGEYEYIEEAREFLSQGNGQEGIDVYALDVKNDLYISMQCKNERVFGPKKIEAAVQSFVNGRFFKKSKKFILCTQRDLGTKGCEEEIEKQRAILRKSNVKLLIWDSRKLNRLLKKFPTIVYDAFDIKVVERFNGPEYAKGFLEKIVYNAPKPTKIFYPKIDNYIERAVSSVFDNVSYDVNNERKVLQRVIENRESTNKHFLLLSEGGSGKSIELAHLAHYFSELGKPFFPIKIELRDYTENLTIETILDSECPNWNNIPKDDLVLLFDGLDEISEKGYGDFIKKMNFFCKGVIGSHIIVTSRTNFYDVEQTEGRFRDFQIITLRSLCDGDIQIYVKKHLDTKSYRFLQKVEDNGLDEMLQTPFYLRELVKLYSKDEKFGVFPRNKSEVIQRVIDESLFSDERKFALNEVSSVDRDRKIELLKLVAFSMTELGTNRLSLQDLKMVVPNEVDRNIFKFTILQYKDNGVQFSHNLLQEYLAAFCIYDKSIGTITSVISYAPDHNRVKRKWINALSFLILLLEKNDQVFASLVDWLVENEPEVIVNFEADKLNNDTRFEIFLNIIDKYKSLGIYIPYSNFSKEELMRFTGTSKRVLKYIIDEIQTGAQAEVKLYFLRSLVEFKNYFGLEGEIKKLLMRCAIDNELNVYSRGAAIEALAYLGSFIDISDVFSYLLDNKLDMSEFEVRQGAFALMKKIHFDSKFVDLALNSIKYLNQVFTSEDATIKEVLLKSLYSRDVQKIIDFIVSSDDLLELSGGRFQFDKVFFKPFIENCIRAFQEQDEIYSFIVKLVEKISHQYIYGEYYLVINRFFYDTKTDVRFFNYNYKLALNNQLDIHRMEVMLSIADMKSLRKLYRDYERGILTYDFIRICRNILGSRNLDLHNKFYRYINLKSANKFDYEIDVPINWAELRIRQQARDQELLLDKRKFMQEVANVFIESNKIILTKEEIFEYRKLSVTHEEKMNNTIVMALLRRWVIAHESVDLKSVEEYYNENNWQIYVFDEVYSLVKNKKEVQRELRQLTIEYLQRSISKVNFRDAITDKVDGGFNYNIFLARLNVFNHAWDLDWPEETLLNLLFTDYYGLPYSSKAQSEQNRPCDFVLRKISETEKIRRRVLENLKMDLSRRVKGSHYRLCELLRIGEAKHFLYRELVADMYDCYDKTSLAEIYLSLGGETTDFLTIFETYVNLDSWFYYLAEKLIRDYEEIVCIRLVNTLVTNVGEFPKQSLKILFQYGRIEAIEYFCNFILSKKQSPIETHFWTTIKKADFPFNEALAMLFNVLLIPFSMPEFDDRNEIYERMDESIVTLINSIALQSEFAYRTAKKSYTFFIETNKDKYPAVKNINYTLQYLDTQYYKTLQDKVTIADVVQLNRSIGLS